MGWLLNSRGSVAPNPALTGVYDGFRRGRHMLMIYPGAEWGGRAYGIGTGDDFRLDPPKPKKGQRVTLHLGASTLGRLVRQRDLRAAHRYGGRRR